MSKVYLHRARWPDKLLGHINEKGDIYRSDLGLDDRIGHVELDSGKIYHRRLGPDEYLGRVDLRSGKVYRHVSMGPDEYLGRVNEAGRMYKHDPLSPDDYIGRISNPVSHAHAGVAFLLLVWPEIEVE